MTPDEEYLPPDAVELPPEQIVQLEQAPRSTLNEDQSSKVAQYLLIYDEQGRVTVTVHDPIPEGYVENICIAQSLNYVLLEGTSPPSNIHDEYYVDVETKELKLRPTMGITPSSNQTITTDQEIQFTNLPIPCNVVVNGEQTIEVDDGSFEMSADVAGDYHLIFQAWPYLDFYLKVIVEENAP